MPFGLRPSSLGLSLFCGLTRGCARPILTGMDDRNGDLYPSKEAGLAAGVPEKHLKEIPASDVIRGTGPFRDRYYRRLPNGTLQRVRPVASDQQPRNKVVADDVLHATGRKQRGSLREQHFQKAFQDA